MLEQKKRNISVSSVLIFSIICLCGCIDRSYKTNPTMAADASAVIVDSLSIHELPLPNVPDALRTPVERAAYITEHFWDAMDFRDTLRSRNTDFMEQNFSNFISVLPFAYKSAQRMAVGTLMLKAEADRAAYYQLAEIAEKYLYEPNSPMLSEELYILFLEQFVSTPLFDKYEAMRYQWQLQAVRKNRPGMVAADFSYTTREGHSTSLRKTAVNGVMLLIFYDPDCEHCKEIMSVLQHNELISQMLDNKRLTVVAVHSGDSRDLWAETSSSFPANWTVGYENGEMQENGQYVFRAMPTLYLLDCDKRVILKDVPVEQLMEWLYRNQL